jgi:hypothetical protein
LVSDLFRDGYRDETDRQTHVTIFIAAKKPTPKEEKVGREIIIIRNVGETCGKLTGENHKSVKPKKTVRQTCAGILGYLSRWPPLFFVFFFVWGLSSLRPSPDDKPREPRDKIRVCAAVI